MTNEEIIKWIETIKHNIENINVDDPKDFNDLKKIAVTISSPTLKTPKLKIPIKIGK